jgi:hypothetical protein
MNPYKYIFLLLLLSACGGSRFTSEHFEFARERDNIPFKADIKIVPDDVDDNMVYYCRQGAYHGRQIVFKGVSARWLIRHAYETNFPRMVWNVEVPDHQTIAEIIVPEPDDDMLQKAFVEAVESTFEISMTKETRTIPVLELRKRAGADITLKKVDASRISWNQEDGKITGIGMTMGLLGIVLEIVMNSQPVFSSGFDAQRYEIDLVWEAGNIDSLNQALYKMGLEVVTIEKPVEMVVIDAAM